MLAFAFERDIKFEPGAGLAFDEHLRLGDTDAAASCHGH